MFLTGEYRGRVSIGEKGGDQKAQGANRNTVPQRHVYFGPELLSTDQSVQGVWVAGDSRVLLHLLWHRKTLGEPPVSAYTAISCDGCDATFSDGGSEISQIRHKAKLEGWTAPLVNNRLHDFCKRCSPTHKHTGSKDQVSPGVVSDPDHGVAVRPQGGSS